ncbi:hypothetical protein L7F22_033482 [Adiantum nelumboides]|nr:hypothetical protein [Adiantum nelumboides]
MLLNFQKAYDSLDWAFLEGTMFKMDFPQAWIQGVSALHRSATAAVKDADRPRAHIAAAYIMAGVTIVLNNIRWACWHTIYSITIGEIGLPIGTKLVFVLMSLYLRGTTPELQGLHMPVDKFPNLLEQEYVDDTMLFCQYAPDTLDSLQSALSVFCCANGSLISWHKSSSFVVGLDDVCRLREQ